MHSQREHLIPAAAAAAEAAVVDLAPAATVTPATASRSRKCKRTTTCKVSTTPTSSNNKLLETFSEFLATRNHHVILKNSSNLPSATNSQRQYDKLVSQADDELHHNLQKLNTARCKKRYNRTMSMLGALLSPSSKSNKRSLLLELIRAPTVLAALFSSLLVLTLIVLYTLSFSHHQAAINSSSSSTTTNSTTNWLFFSSPSSLSSDNIRQPPAGRISLARSHRISGRDLASDEIGEQQLHWQSGDEEDDESGNELADDDELLLPEGLSRALSVQTECGLLMGSAEDNGLVFRGIPYASPPVSARRWQRPQPIWLDEELCNSTGSGKSERSDDLGKPAETPTTTTSSSGNRGRRRQGRHCAQLDPITNRFTGQEDCLYLDIYLPRLDQNKLPKLPVMVYIHGGFLAFGSGSGSGHLSWMKAKPSARLAAELDVIIVAFNYRLQALGFLTLPQSDSRSSSGGGGGGGGHNNEVGNFGLWDQLTALNWIRRNIESFGGDPENIVLFGPDSASSLVWALMSGGGQKQSPSQQDSRLQEPPLFRAAWLTNPTIFYDLPYDLASQHYQRLFQQNQSRCQPPAPFDHNNGSQQLQQQQQQQQPTRNESNLRDCLMQLNGEQVMRHYLGPDHPSYRLDDQNSLPIHGIFVDQFVTIDGELVRDSFPFSRGNAAAPSSSSLAETNLPKSSSSSGNNSSHYAKEDQPTNEHTTIDLLIGSSAQAVEHWPCPRNLNQWTWDDFKRYVATSLNSFATDLYRSASILYKVPKRDAAAAAVGGNKTNNTSHLPSPAWTYLSMVSDIRQICPINELVNGLRKASGSGAVDIGQQANVHRYIVEATFGGESERAPMSTKEEAGNYANLDSVSRRSQIAAAATTATSQTTNSGRPKFAYHTKELNAFFGYEFEPSFRPQMGDLKFQTKIRQMVKQFVHKQTHQTDEAKRKQEELQNSGKVVVLDENGNTKYVDNYREAECSMWRRHLGKSYAWIS